MMLQRPAIAPISVVWPPPDRDVKKKWAGVCRMGGVGDNLVAASVLAPLKRAGYMTEVIAQAPHHVIFENNPFMDRLIVKQKEDFPGDGGLQWQQWFDARGREYDLFANLSHTMEHLVAFFPGQTAFYWPAPFRRKMADHSYIELVHDMFGMSHDFGRLFWPTEEEREDVLEKRRQFGSDRLIGWCLSGTRIDKVYPYAPMVISRIIRELGAHVILLGAPSLQHIEMAKMVESEVARHNGSVKGLSTALSLDGGNPQWPMRRILAMAGACDLMIGPDTGPMWAVAFESMPKIVMLSHASEKNITSHWVNTKTLHADQSHVPCWPCHRLHDSHATCRPNKENNGAACISDISVETIVSTAAKLMEVTYG